MSSIPPDTVALFQAQLEYLRSDERLREVAAAADPRAEQRLEQAWVMSRSAAAMLDALPKDVRRRVESFREPLGPGAAQVLRRLSGAAPLIPSDDPDAG